MCAAQDGRPSSMVTNITSYANESDSPVTSFNEENRGNSFDIKPKSILPTGGQWIPQHKDRALVITTKYGTCRVWDDDWKILGQQGSKEFVFLSGRKQG